MILDCEKNSLASSDISDKDLILEQADNNKSIIYYINDSVYGSFKWYSLKDSYPIMYSTSPRTVKKYVRSCVGGGTCDSGDFILRNCLMPELEIGDFLIFRNMGSYTKACAIDFCGIKLPETIYVSSKLWDSIKDAFGTNRNESNVKNFQDSNNKLSAKKILKEFG